MVCKISIATKGAANKFTIGIKNINAPIIPNSQPGQNNSFLNSFTSIKDNLRNPNASEYSLEIK